jgi:pSer/pThr/pTyr-binding forkhead associated (FHA) protein
MDRDVSRHHCVLIETDSDETLVMDLSSSNGTLVENQRVSQSIMGFGMKLQIGTCVFVYEYNEEAHNYDMTDVKLMSGRAMERTSLRGFGDSGSLESDLREDDCASHLHQLAIDSGWAHCPECGGGI